MWERSLEHIFKNTSNIMADAMKKNRWAQDVESECGMEVGCFQEGDQGKRL